MITLYLYDSDDESVIEEGVQRRYWVLRALSGRADHGNGGGLKTRSRKTVDRLISCRIKGIKYLI